jgi:hypothetical protein
MSNVKVQSSNEIQNPNAKNIFGIWSFDIDLTFGIYRSE